MLATKKTASFYNNIKEICFCQGQEIQAQMENETKAKETNEDLPHGTKDKMYFRE